MMVAAAEPMQRFETRSRYDGYSWRPSLPSLRLLKEARSILAASPRPMTVRQLYYRLVAGLFIPNNIRSYQNLVGLLTKARKVDLLDTGKFVDRARAVSHPTGYGGLNEYVDIIRQAYRRRPNDGQPHYVEVWTEKDALSAVIGDVVEPFGATVVVSKGYTSYTVLVEAAKRFEREIGERSIDEVHLLYFGDFDPSGEDIFRVIGSEMEALVGVEFHIEKIALTRDLIDEHGLPPIPTKSTDSRTDRFRAAHGDEAVELDALPPDIFDTVVADAIQAWFDEDISRANEQRETRERDALTQALSGLDQILGDA